MPLMSNREGCSMQRAMSIVANGDYNANKARATMLTSTWNLELEIRLTRIIHVQSPRSRFKFTFSETHHDGDARITSMYRVADVDTAQSSQSVLVAAPAPEMLARDSRSR